MLDIKPCQAEVVIPTMGRTQALPIVFTFEQCEDYFIRSSSFIPFVLCVCQAKMAIKFCNSVQDAQYFYFGYNDHCGAV